jgi:hypothetical protein
MKNLITKKHKHMLWQDELGEDFLLLKYAEVYRYSQDILRVVVFTVKNPPTKLSLLRKEGVILNEFRTDDPLLILDIDKQYLPRIIALGDFKRRPNKNGAWIKDKEQRLAHKILPYRPDSLTKD